VELCCKQTVMQLCPDPGHRNFPVEDLADSGWSIRAVPGPSWAVDLARLMVPVVEVLLAGGSILAPVDQWGGEGIGGEWPVCVAALTLVPARGIAQFENVVLTGDGAKCMHARGSVSSRRLDHHSVDRYIETLMWIAQFVAGCADCHVD